MLKGLGLLLSYNKKKKEFFVVVVRKKLKSEKRVLHKNTRQATVSNG